MSPLSKVKELLKCDVQDLKEKASQSFYKNLTHKQIMHHELQLSLSASKAGDKDEAANKFKLQKGPAHDLRTSLERLNPGNKIDPIGYYENRYFPFGFDDPNKVAQYHHHAHNNPNGNNNESFSNLAGKSEYLMKIQEYERKCVEENDRNLEFSNEQDFDRRQSSFIFGVTTSLNNQKSIFRYNEAN